MIESSLPKIGSPPTSEELRLRAIAAGNGAPAREWREGELTSRGAARRLAKILDRRERRG
jgi:hypothetical protein